MAINRPRTDSPTDRTRNCERSGHIGTRFLEELGGEYCPTCLALLKGAKRVQNRLMRGGCRFHRSRRRLSRRPHRLYAVKQNSDFRRANRRSNGFIGAETLDHARADVERSHRSREDLSCRRTCQIEISGWKANVTARSCRPTLGSPVLGNRLKFLSARNIRADLASLRSAEGRSLDVSVGKSVQAESRLDRFFGLSIREDLSMSRAKLFLFAVACLLPASATTATAAGAPNFDEDVVVVAQAQGEANAAKVPERVMERAAGRLAGPAGASIGALLGYSIGGMPGAIIGSAMGAAAVEVFAEFIVSRMLRPMPMPGWQPPMLQRP
jgi:hypothetical protein